jgi:hypothetical protein
LKDEILRIERLASEEELCNALINSASHLEVKMRRPDARCIEWIWSRLDGRKPEPALPISELDSVTLEVSIERRRIRIGRMIVATKGVGLPKFNARVTDRLAALVKNPANYVNDLSLSSAAVAPDVDQVGILVRRLNYGIEGAGRSARRCRQAFLSPSPKEAPRYPDSRDAGYDAKPEKLSPRCSPFVRIHLDSNLRYRIAPNEQAFSGEPSERSERPERMRGRRVRCNAMLGANS